MLLENKVALITGAANGIGAACARLFAREGAAVLLADREAAAGERLARELSEAGHRARFVACDVSREEDIEGMVAAALTAFGRLDCAVNNAGIVGPSARIEETELESWQQVIAVNLTGVMLCMKHEIKLMRAQGSGAIVNVSSGAGLIGVPNMAAYSASKHGVLGLTKTAAKENVKRGIRVNAVLPGSTRTPQLEASIATGGEEVEKMILGSVPCGRFGQPDEIAQNIAWLCSESASYVSGVSLPVDNATLCH